MAGLPAGLSLLFAGSRWDNRLVSLSVSEPEPTGPMVGRIDRQCRDLVDCLRDDLGDFAVGP